MKSSEQKTSSSASHLQAKASDSFFSKTKGESFSPDHASSAPFFPVQTKLDIHPADDVFEKEADSVADKIMQQQYSPPPPVQRQENEEGEGIQLMRLANNITPLQAQRAFESPTAMEQNSAHDEMSLQTKSEGDGGEASSGMESQLQSSKGGGSALSEAARSRMESGFGTDFNDVRVHTGSDAVQMNRDIGARAFTHGNDIYFNEGEYQPSTSKGDHLLAHELTHTVQQGGGVQKKALSIQKAGIKDVTAAQLDAITPGKQGKIERKGDDFEFTLTSFIIKGYADVEFAKAAGPRIAKPESGTRKTQQAPIWKKEVIDLVRTYLDAMLDPSLKNEMLNLELKSNKGTRLIGNFEQILERVVIPLWNKDGKPAIYEVEHMIDYQVLGEHADKIENLMLLNRATNNLYGKTIKAKIQDHVTDILTFYRTKGVKDLPKTGAEAKEHIKIFYDTASFIPDTVAPGDIIFKKSLETINPYNPFQKKHVDFGKASIPKDHMVLKTRADGVGYILPYNGSKIPIGGFLITTKGDPKTGKLTYLRLDPLAKDKKSIIKKKIEPIDTAFTEEGVETKIFLVESKSLSAKIKQMIALEGLSPVDFSEVTIDGFDVKAKGKVLSDVSFLQGVDITITLDNGNIIIQALLPLDQLQSKIPKPFVITGSNIAIEASSDTGLSISGLLKFKIGSFGEGEVSASMGTSTGFTLAGNFNFNSKWFKPAEINFDYKKGKWSIGGTIGIEDGMVKGVKKATLAVKYANETFSADGDAKLDVPGVDSVKLSAMFSEAAGFKFVATADLKKLPGIKSGSVTVSLLSKGGGDVKLGVGGTAEPDFPAVPGLTTSLSVMYEDGVFEMKAKVGYKKGRFDGSIEVGVTNKAVDEKGAPQGEPQKGDVVVFGFGSLTVDLFKGSKGTISARLTPDKQLLVAGSFTVKDLHPFGEGVNIHKKIVEFPNIKIPLVGIPGVSIFFEIGGGAYFNFNWDPLALKELTISFTETNINEIETAQVNIHGDVGSKAVAEAYMEIKASLGAEILIAEIKGSLAGDAGIKVEAEAGGSLDATWNNEKGLQLKQITAYLNVTPKAFFRLKGSISVDLDLWITTINLYYKEWVLAEGSADLGALALKVNFPLKFDENGDLIRPGFEELSIDKPDFSGDQGKSALDSGINADAKKERKLAKDKLRQDIANDMRNSVNDEDFSPSEYAKGLQKKYSEDEEMKAFIMDSVEEEVALREKQEFEDLKQELFKSELPLNAKIGRAYAFKLFRSRISFGDFDAFLQQLRLQEQLKQEQQQKAQQQPANQSTPTT